MSFRVVGKIIVSGLALLMLQTLVQACADGSDPYDYYPSFFDNRLAGKDNSDFLQFRYSALTGRFYESWYDTDSNLTTADTADGNRAEWAAYAGGLPLADVDSFVYTYPRTSLSALYYNIEKGTATGSTQTYEGNAMTKWFRRAKDLEALGYLMWAKQVEEATTKPGDYSWEAPPPPDAAQLQKLQKGGGQLLAAAKNGFIKQRYAYQILKMLFQGKDYKAVLRRYDSLAGGAAGNMATRMLGLKAGAHFRLGEKTKAAYLYSRVFDQGPEWRHTAYISYDWTDGFKQTPAVLKWCTTPHEKAVVHLLSGIYEYNQALPQMQAAAKEDPAIAGLEALFTREINKTEERYLEEVLTTPLTANKELYTPYGSYMGNEAADKKSAAYQEYVGRLIGFGKVQVARVPVAQQGYWHIALAYLGYLQKDDALLETQLALAEKVSLSPIERDQVSVLQLLQIAKLKETLTPAVEAQMLPHLERLDARRGHAAGADKVYRDFTGAFLAGRYLAQKDTVKALFTLAKSQRGWTSEGEQRYFVANDYTDNPGTLLQQLSPAGFEAAKDFSAGKNLSAYDRWLIKQNPYPVGSLYELEGTRKMRYLQFAEAVQLYAKVPPAEMQKRLFPDPFIFEVSHFLNDEVADTTAALTRLDFAKKMVVLQSKTDAQGLFDYGLGLYGMTYYGSAHRAYDYFRSSTSDLGYYEDSARLALSAPEREYYGAFAAEQAFVKAAAATTNKELKAAAVFMASKCWQKRAPVTKRISYYNDDGTYYRYSLKSPYFKMLKGELSGTQTYSEILRKCDFFADYVKKR
jgi:hypothetical protein